MRIRCTRNLFCDLPLHSAHYTADTAAVFDIDIGREYLVYALSVDDRDIACYICAANYTYYPCWYPISLFEVTDGTLSRYWQCTTLHTDKRQTPYLLFAFPEWANQPAAYYWNLTERTPHALQTWEQYKRLLEDEFAGNDQ